MYHRAPGDMIRAEAETTDPQWEDRSHTDLIEPLVIEGL